MKHLQITLSLVAIVSFNSLAQHGPAPKPEALSIQQDFTSTNLHTINSANILNNNNLRNNKMGTPFLYPYWSKGTATLTNGIKYEGLKMIYDQLNDRPLFCEDESLPQAFAEPVLEFTIPVLTNDVIVGERKFRSGSVYGADPKTFYEVLVEGKVSVLKKVFKKIVEENAVGSNLKSKQIKEVYVKYYLSKSGRLNPIKKEKKSIIGSLKDKSVELDNYIRENKLNLKEDEDVCKLVVYYNSLL